MGVLDDVDRLVRDPLELRRDAGRHKQKSHVPADRLLQRGQLDGAVVDFNLEVVHLLFFAVNLGAERLVALDQNSERGLNHRFRQSAHQEQPFEQLLYFFVQVAH